MPAQRPRDRLRTKLAASVGMQDAAGDVTATGDGVLDRVDDDVGMHRRLDRVADDPIGPGVFDHAAVELAFGRPMLRQIREPEPVRRISGEQSLHEVIEHRRARLLALAASAALRSRDRANLRRQRPRGPATHPQPSPAGEVRQLPIAERRIIDMAVEQHVHAASAQPFSVSDRVALPPVVGLTGELENPARHRDGHPVIGELAHERVDHFGEPPSFRFACDRYAAAFLRTSFSCSSNRFRRRRSRTSATSSRV